MIRLILSPSGEVAVDLAGGRFGRGAHVHTAAACLASAHRGLSKSFRRQVQVSASELGAALRSAADKRVRGLLSSAARAKALYVGAEMAGAAFDNGAAHLLVVATDAAAAASVGRVRYAVAQGGAVAWGTKEDLGSLVGKSEVGVLGISSQPIAVAVRSAVMMANGVAERGESSPEERLQGAMATEDR